MIQKRRECGLKKILNCRERIFRNFRIDSRHFTIILKSILDVFKTHARQASCGPWRPAGHEVFAAKLLVLQGHCLHTYDDEENTEAELKERVAMYSAAEERVEGKRRKAEACWVDRVD